MKRRALHCPRAPPAGVKVRGRSAEGPVEPPRYGDPRRSERCRRRCACALQSRRQGERTADVGGREHSPRDRLRVRPGVGLPRPPGLQPRRPDSSSTAADRCALDAIYRPGGAGVQGLYRQERVAPAPVERSGALIPKRAPASTASRVLPTHQARPDQVGFQGSPGPGQVGAKRVFSPNGVGSTPTRSTFSDVAQTPRMTTR
jgi:hypothetical protein